MIPLTSKITDLGEFSVARVIPNIASRSVGPFVFFDLFGPARFSAGQGINVRPHPHIGLATITYLIDGQILHRDSLGNQQVINPGDVNYMVAGRGITHSERETLEQHCQPHTLSGIQCWIALPEEDCRTEPSFSHFDKSQLPCRIHEGTTARLVLGDAYGLNGPTKTFSPMFLLDVVTHEGSPLERPNPTQECLVWVVTGEVVVSDEGGTASHSLKQGDVALLDADAVLSPNEFSRLIFLGGQKLEKTPKLWWNFVAYDDETMEQAKRDWRDGKFPTIPGDDLEFIPLKDG